MKIPVYLSILLAVTFLAGCGNDSSKPAQTGSGNGSPLDNRGDYLSTLAKGKISAVKTVDTAALNQAVQMFNVQEGRFPKDLDELVKSKLIGEIPAAPAGMKIVYDSTTGQVKVVNQ
jgi:hypothetical protein